MPTKTKGKGKPTAPVKKPATRTMKPVPKPISPPVKKAEPAPKPARPPVKKAETEPAPEPASQPPRQHPLAPVIINGKEFKLTYANPVISDKLSARYKRKIICREFLHNQRSDLIKELIGPYAIRNLKYQCRFYKLDFLEYRVNSLRRFYIGEIDSTLGFVFDKLKAENIKVFLHGGIVRDLLMGVRSADIDIIFDKDVQAIKPLCEKYRWPCSEIMVREQYINFGISKGAGLEGANLSKTFMAPLWEHEASINALAYDLQNNVLIDITGYGLEDIARGQFRLGAHPHDWLKWAKDAKRPFRYFKLIQKGFAPINEELHNFVTGYIRDNWETVYNRPIHKDYPIPWIKQILIKTMTQGTIDEKTGAYSFGPTEDKLMPFLETIKKHIGNDIFMKIMATFTDADLKHFYEKRIITSENRYIKYKDLLAKIRAKAGLPMESKKVKKSAKNKSANASKKAKRAK